MKKMPGNLIFATNKNGKLKVKINRELMAISLSKTNKVVRIRDFQIKLVCEANGFVMEGFSNERHNVLISKTSRGYCILETTKNGTYKKVSRVSKTFKMLEKSLEEYFLTKF